MSDANTKKGRKPMSAWQRFALNVKIIILIVVLIMLGFFGYYMYKTSLDDVLTEKDGTASQTVTTVYELGGDSSAVD